MQIKELQVEVDRVNKDLCNKYGYELGSRENVMRCMIKLGEEHGELCETILSSFGMQSKRKLEKHSIEDTMGELADVIVCTMVLAREMGIDIEDILVSKLQALDKRLQG